MAFPHGRLLAARGGTVYVLSGHGWVRLGPHKPRNAEPLTRKQAEEWCARTGDDVTWLDAVPAEVPGQI